MTASEPSPFTEKDIESNGLVVGQKPRFRERVYNLRNKCSGRWIITLAVLVFLVVNYFNQSRIVLVVENHVAAPHLYAPDGAPVGINAAAWTLKGWAASNSSTALLKDGCSGTPLVDVTGADDQKCTPVVSSSKRDVNLEIAGTELAWVTWDGNQTYSLCLYSDAGCSTWVASYKSPQNCQDGHDATYYSVIHSTKNCTGQPSKKPHHGD